jgi:hypothetical protein
MGYMVHVPREGVADLPEYSGKCRWLAGVVPAITPVVADRVLRGGAHV